MLRVARVALSNRELLAVLFYVTGGVVRGATRIQKTVFLLQQELGVGSFAFVPSKYGPWSKELADALHELESSGVLNIRGEETDTGAVTVYRADKSFLDEGRAKFRGLQKRDPILAMKLYRHTRIYASLPLTYLLAYVYRRYPEYTTASEIAERVSEWQRMYGLTSRG